MNYQSPPVEIEVVASARHLGHALYRVLVTDSAGQYGRLTHYRHADRAKARSMAEAMARLEQARHGLVEEIDTANGLVVDVFKPEI